MSETLSASHQQGSMLHNMDKLREAEYGHSLREIYKTACELDPRLKDVDIIPLPEGEAGVARALPAWRSPNGNHWVEINMHDVDETLQKVTTMMDAIPGARNLFASRMGIRPEEVTPEIMHAFALAHELGHISEFMDNEVDPSALERRNKIEKDALPIAGVTVSAMMHVGSAVNTAISQNWEAVSAHTGAEGFEQLLGMQHDAYRGTTSERVADTFAGDILMMNPTLVDQLTGPNRAQYRNLPVEIYG